MPGPWNDEWHDVMVESGYPFCRPCDEYHRPPECAVNEKGEPLVWCGCTWAETEQPGYYDQPCRHQTEDLDECPTPVLTVTARAARPG